MAQTVIPVGDPKAIKKYSAFLAKDTPPKSYFGRKFMGQGAASSMPVQSLSELENDAGDEISFDLTMQMTMAPVEDDDILENKEQALAFYSDGVKLGQLRGGVNGGGAMTRKRTIHNMRKLARERQSNWWARVFDELFFMYGSGARGTNGDFLYSTSYAGFAGNAFSAPDAEHIVYAGGHVKNTIVVGDTMKLAEIDKVKTKAIMLGATADTAGTDGNKQTPAIQPIKINGEDHFVVVMSPWQAHDLRAETGDNGWLSIQKAAAGAEGRKSPIFSGTLGMYNNVVMHEHMNVIRFTDYGASTPPVIHAARALFMGEQAMVCAFGSPGTGLRFKWNEETRDNGNQLVITSSTIVGIKKATYNGKDYGMMVLDTAAKDPS